MYRITVPIQDGMIDRCSAAAYLQELKRMDASRVLLCTSPCDPIGEEGKRSIDSLQRHTAFFKQNGLEVGCWIWTFNAGPNTAYTYMRSPSGAVSQNEVCPSDPDWQIFMGNFLAAVAETGIDLIQFDDDFRFGFQDMGLGCTCPRHLALMAKELGYEPKQEELLPLLFAGKPNPVRSAWIHANGKMLESFAAAMRRRIDAVRPSVRLGYCTCMTNWDIDGTHPDRIARIMAGNTKPFYRLIGAPYWAALHSWGSRMGDVIELSRMEKSFNLDSDIEIIAEGDVYPRPRFRVPAAYLEAFDTALRADGTLDGIIKYGLDYTSDVGYENGYRIRHELNRERYAAIFAMFDGKTAVGVRVYESPAKYERMEVLPTVSGSDDVQKSFFSYAARMLTSCSVPLRWDGGEGPGAVFGANAMDIPACALEQGLLMDAEAAKILTERGFDVGLRVYGEALPASREEYPSFPGSVALDHATVRKLTIDPRAEIESRYYTAQGYVPAAYHYENAKGQCFYVLCFDGFLCGESLYRQYEKARRIAEAFARFGTPLPVHIIENPDVYVLAKESADHSALAIGIWNFFPDDIPTPVLQLARPYSKVRTLQGEAVLDGNTVRLSRIEPYGMAFVEVYD